MTPQDNTLCDGQLLTVVTWKPFSQFICFLWQKGLMWVHLHSATYKSDIVWENSVVVDAMSGVVYISHVYISILPYIKLTWYSWALKHWLQLVWVYMWHGYVCILLHLKLTWYTRILYNSGKLGDGISHVGMSVSLHMSK